MGAADHKQQVKSKIKNPTLFYRFFPLLPVLFLKFAIFVLLPFRILTLLLKNLYFEFYKLIEKWYNLSELKNFINCIFLFSKVFFKWFSYSNNWRKGID